MCIVHWGFVVSFVLVFICLLVVFVVCRFGLARLAGLVGLKSVVVVGLSSWLYETQLRMSACRLL